MRPMKPRAPGSVFEMLEQFYTQLDGVAGGQGRGIELAADFEGKSHFTLRHEIDPDDKKHRMSLVSFARQAAHFKVSAAAEYFAMLAGGAFLPLPRCGEARWSELTSEAVEEMGRFAAEVIADLAAGKMDASEAKRCLPILCEILRHVSGLVSLARERAAGGQP